MANRNHTTNVEVKAIPEKLIQVRPVAPDAVGALLTLAEEVSDAADTLACAVETTKDLIALALKELELDTSTRAGSAIRGARVFLFQLDDMVERLQILSGEAKGRAA